MWGVVPYRLIAARLAKWLALNKWIDCFLSTDPNPQSIKTVLCHCWVLLRQTVQGNGSVWVAVAFIGCLKKGEDD